MTIFFTADTHFGHANIIKLVSRPFESVEAMDEALIQNWNSVVGPADTVWHLGDFEFRSAEDQTKYFDRLNGNKNLVVGNHDGLKVLRYEWDTVTKYKELTVGEFVFMLFHYPILEWDGYYRDTWHLHGHVHRKTRWWGNGIKRLDVGVDANQFRPIAMEELLRDEGVKL